MALRIQNNVEAFGAHRRLVDSSTRMAKSMERLSSGFRINRGGDDAAGLGISERMRAQARGLGQAQRNIQDGISLVQTAEGNLNEVHAMLQRIRELAVQHKNGSLSGTDQLAIQSEVTQLSQEIERIGATAQFNGIQVLNSTVTVAFQIGTADGDQITAAMVSLGNSIGTLYSQLLTGTAGSLDLGQIDGAINAVSAQRATLGGDPEPPRAQPPGRRRLPGEPGRRREPDPRRRHGGGDGPVHEVLDPRAGRPGDARPGQPGPVAGSVAAPVAPELRIRSSSQRCGRPSGRPFRVSELRRASDESGR